MGHCLIALEGFLIGEIDDISRPHISQQILLAPHSLLSLLLLDDCLHIVLVTARLMQSWDKLGIDYLRIIPLWLSGLAVFTIESLSGYPFLVVGGLIKDRAFRGVSNDDSLLDLQGEGSAESIGQFQH